MSHVHALAAISNAAMTSVGNTKADNIAHDKRIATTDDRTIAASLVNEAIATVLTGYKVWTQYSLRLMGMTIEGRAYFIEMLDSWRKAQTKANADATGTDAKILGARMRSATVQLSKLRTIAKALNAGMTRESLAAYVKGKVDETLGFELFYEHAKTFNDSTAGRKADTWLVKMGKMLERNKPAEDDAEGVKAYDQFVKLYNELVK